MLPDENDRSLGRAQLIPICAIRRSRLAPQQRGEAQPKRPERTDLQKLTTTEAITERSGRSLADSQHPIVLEGYT